MSENKTFKDYTKELIAVQKELIQLREDLNTANKKYHDTKEITYTHVEFKNIMEAISILEKKEELLKEERSLL